MSNLIVWETKRGMRAGLPEVLLERFAPIQEQTEYPLIMDGPFQPRSLAFCAESPVGPNECFSLVLVQPTFNLLTDRRLSPQFERVIRATLLLAQAVDPGWLDLQCGQDQIWEQEWAPARAWLSHLGVQMP